MVEAETEPDETDEPSDEDEETEETSDEDEAAADEEQPDETMQQRLAALGRENTRHAKAFAKALELEVDDLHVCPVCQGDGFTPDLMAPPPELKQHPDLHRCDTCGGTGILQTGSFHPGDEQIGCPTCGSRGYVGSAPTVSPNGPVTQAAPPVAQGPSLVVTDTADAETIAELRAKGYIVSDAPLAAVAST